VAAHRSDRLHGGGALTLADHRQLAEVIARAQRPDPVSVHQDRGLALGDDEEGNAAHLALLGQARADRNATLPEQRGKLSKLAA
jgi:hypothetical protein